MLTVLNKDSSHQVIFPEDDLCNESETLVSNPVYIVLIESRSDPGDSNSDTMNKKIFRLVKKP